MNSRQTVSLWELVERLEKLAAEFDLPPDKWVLLCHRLAPEWYADPAQPKEPTSLEPGSEEKIRLMQRRAKGGKSVFHAEDKRGNLRDLRPDCVPDVQVEPRGFWDED
jgi:hypothetical protein